MKRKVRDKGDEFFVTGLAKYLDAVSALMMFEKDIQRRVKEVITKHRSKLGELFGEDWSLKDYYQTGTDWKSLARKWFSSGELFFMFCFARDEAGGSYIYPEALFWRARVTSLSELWTSAAAVRSPKPKVDNSRIVLTGARPTTNDWASCEKELNAVVRDWIKVWQKLGGLPKYLPRSAR